jgi:hypothetical protein
MRKPILVMVLAASAAQAAPADMGGPHGAALAPGQPAGVRAAQLSNTNTMLFVGLGVVVLGAGLYLASGTYKTRGPSQSGQAATGTSP